MRKNIEKWKINFYTIWVGQAISLITSAVLQMAIIFYLTEKTGSAMVLSISSMMAFLPYALLGPFIGVLVDRYNRKAVMIISDLMIAVAGVILAIIALFMELPVWMIMIILLIRSLGSAFHSPALSAVTPLLVPEDQLIKCAGYSQSIQSVSLVISPAIAAFLYSVWQLNAIIALDVAGAVIASITVAIIKIPNLEGIKQKIKSNFMLELKDGFLALKENRGLFTLLLIGTLYMFVYMPLNALYPLMSTKHFMGSAAHISATEVAFALGMLLGGLLLGIMGKFKKRTLLLSSSVLLMGISLIISGLLPATWFAVFVLCCGFMGFSVPFYSGIQTALFQESIKPEYLGRVFSLTGSIVSVTMPVGLILSGLFAEIIGVSRWFFASGILIMAISVLCFISPSVRNLDIKIKAD